jgi:hypothetical protein
MLDHHIPFDASFLEDPVLCKDGCEYKSLRLSSSQSTALARALFAFRGLVVLVVLFAVHDDQLQL